MNHYKTSTGARLSKKTIDIRVRKAKEQKLSLFMDEYGYYFCEECKTNQGYIDCSHDISVDKCQKMGRSELAFDVNNITLRCRKHHEEHDKL